MQASLIVEESGAEYNAFHCCLTVWFDRQEVTILAIGGRIKLSFEVTEHYRQYLNWKNTSADLMRDRKGRWWL
jgi:hypothetical protein